MIVLIAAVLGAATGGLSAYRRKGRPVDILLYCVVYAIIFAIMGLFATLIIHRMAL